MLQIVTKRSNTLKKLRKTVYQLAFILMLSACASPTQPVDNQPQKPTTAAQTVIEPHKGRITPETSVARTLKYNIEAVKQAASAKILGEEARDNAFVNLKKIRENGGSPLSVSLKELDFAILYASAAHSPSPEQIDALFNHIMAQNLVQAALKAHKTALYDQKKIFEVRRKIRQYQKQLAALIKRQKNTASSELTYKKALEDSIDRLKQMEAEMSQNLNDFYQLTKIDNPKTELEGRRFFDGFVLQPRAKAEDYQAAALTSRPELDGFSRPSLEKTAAAVTAEYPENNDMIKGFYIQDATYLKSLSARGDSLATKLLQTAHDYQKAGRRKKEILTQKLEDELRQAIYTQTELAYSLYTRAAADYEAQQSNLRQLKHDIQKMEKIRKPDEQQQTELLLARISLLENENTADQILAEKAMTIAALQFYGGQISITPEFLQQDIAALSKYFKTALIQKIPDYKISDGGEEHNDFLPEEEKEDNSWAHSENWLETLMSEPRSATPLPKHQATASQPKIDYNLYTVLQLGAFVEKNTAEEEWQKLSSIFPELKKYTPAYETASVAGINLYRLQISSPNGGFKELCIKLRRSGHECFLHD